MARKGISRGNLISPWPDLSHLQETDAAYLAGIIDGEGWIGVMTHNSHSNYEIGVGTVSIELIEWFRAKLPFLSVTKRKLVPRISGGTRQQGYEMHLRGARRVTAVLLTVLPYLTIKRQKAIDAIYALDVLYRLHEELPTLLLPMGRLFPSASQAYPSPETGLSHHLHQ